MAELAEVHVGVRALHHVFAREGYHCRVAQVKPYLSPATREKQRVWAEQYRNWQVVDWSDVIWSDECALSVGDVSGTV